MTGGSGGLALNTPGSQGEKRAPPSFKKKKPVGPSKGGVFFFLWEFFLERGRKKYPLRGRWCDAVHHVRKGGGEKPPSKAERKGGGKSPPEGKWRRCPFEQNSKGGGKRQFFIRVTRKKHGRLKRGQGGGRGGQPHSAGGGGGGKGFFCRVRCGLSEW